MRFLNFRLRSPAAASSSRAGLGFIAVAICLDVISHSIAFPLMPKLVQSMVGQDAGAAARWVGILIGAWALAQFLAAPVIGMLSDRFGRRPVILMSAFGLAFDLAVMALAPNIAWLFIGRVLCGLTAGAQGACMAYVADITPPEERSRSYGLLNSAAWSGVILGPALGGFLSLNDIRTPFWVAAAVSLVMAIYGLLVLPESLPPERRAPLRWRTANPVAAMSLYSERPGLVKLGVIVMLLWFAMYALNSVFVLFTAYRYGWTPVTLGLFFSVMAGVNILIQSQVAGRAAKAMGEWSTVVLGLVLQIIGLVIQGFAPWGWLFSAAYVVVCFGSIAGPALQSMMTSFVGADEQGRLQGANGAVTSLTGLFGPIAFTQVFAWSIAIGQGGTWSGLSILLGAGLTVLALYVTLITPRIRITT